MFRYERVMRYISRLLSMRVRRKSGPTIVTYWPLYHTWALWPEASVNNGRLTGLPTRK